MITFYLSSFVEVEKVWQIRIVRVYWHLLTILFLLVTAGHSPRLLAAAQTLYDISSHSLKQHGMLRWPKKPSEKTMKACKSNTCKPGEIFASPKPVIATDDRVKNTDEVSPFKKPRLLNKDLGPNTVTKAPINWSMQRSNRPSPGKSFRDPIVEAKQHNNAYVVKQSGLMPPPPVRVSDNTCNSRQKLRKLLPVEWNREGGRWDELTRLCWILLSCVVCRLVYGNAVAYCRNC